MSDQPQTGESGTASNTETGQNVPEQGTGSEQPEQSEQQQRDADATPTGDQKRQAYLDDLERIRNEP